MTVAIDRARVDANDGKGQITTMTQPVTIRAIKRLLVLSVAAASASACSFSFSTGTDETETTGDTAAAAGEADTISTTETTAPQNTTITTTPQNTTITATEPTTAEPAEDSNIVLVRQTAEDFIASTIADQFGEPLEPSCPTIPNTAAGTTFDCVATTPGGETVKLVASITGDDDLNVVTTNVVVADFMAELGTVGARVLTDANLGDVTIDCGTKSVVLDANQEMECDSVDKDGSAGSVTYTITDTQTGQFEVRIN